MDYFEIAVNWADKREDKCPFFSWNTVQPIDIPILFFD